MASVALSSGHGLKVRGASGYIDEVNEARKVCDRVGQLLKDGGHKCLVFHENTATSVNQNLTNITNWHNAQTRDRDVSCHFNAYQTTGKAMGTECLYVTQQQLASTVSAAMAKAGGFINRGPKKRTDLWFLNKCAKPAILLEVCFVDSSADVNLYHQNFEGICRAIAESIAGVKLDQPPVEPPPTEPPPTEPPELTGDHSVDVAFTTKGSPQVTINGDILIDGDPANRLDLQLKHQGDIIVTIDGELFQVKPVQPTGRPVIGVGDRGPDVTIVQESLEIPADGIFGSQTESAVKQFQTAQSLVVDGVVGEQTWQALERVYDLPPYEAPPAMAWLNEDIKASVFGGGKDPNKSAYPPYDTITDKELSVALPWKFAGGRPKVRVVNRANRREVVCQIRDLGPWLIDDPYWDLGKRPLAETCAKNGTPLPRGPNKGKVPNGAGIDLTPAAAKSLGISGMGQVDWQFV